MITTEQIRTLNDARTILRDLDPPHDWSGGFAKAVVRDAEQGVFEALNVLRAYLDAVITEEQMHNKESLDVTRSLGRADSVVVEGMEDGFEMKISTDRGVYVVNVHARSRELLRSVLETIGEYWAEADLVGFDGERADFERKDAYDLRNAYPASDPKHPDWHSVHSDLYDSREGK